MNHQDTTAAPTASQATDRFRKLIDVLPIGVFATGKDMQIRWMNREAMRLLGAEGKCVAGEKCEEVLQCTFCGTRCAAQDALATGEIRHEFPVEILGGAQRELAVRIDAYPMGDDEVAVVLRDVTEAETLRRSIQDRSVFHGLVYASPAMRDVVARVSDLAPTDSPVLVYGEPGTEKESVARALHAEGPWWAEPFLVVRCAGVPVADLETSLFGGGSGDPGALERAEGGTLFITSLDSVPLGLQARLAEALATRALRRKGEDKNRPIDARVIAATDRDPSLGVTQGWLYEGLEKRFASNRIHVPALRDRREDVAGLVDVLLPRSARRAGKTIRGVTEDAMAILKAHPWPGNVRQVEHTLDVAAARSTNGRIQVRDLPPEVRAAAAGGPESGERVCEALRRAAGSVTRAARLLGVHRTTLWRWMGAAGLSREDFFPS